MTINENNCNEQMQEEIQDIINLKIQALEQTEAIPRDLDFR